MNSFRSKSHLCEGGFFLDELEIRDDSVGDSGADAVLDVSLLARHFVELLDDIDIVFLAQFEGDDYGVRLVILRRCPFLRF